MSAKALLWLLVPLAGVLELVAHQYFATRAPDRAEWEALAGFVRAQRRPGDLVLVTPYWAEPNARAALGDALMPLDHVARADVSVFQRAIEVSALGGTAEETASWPVVEEHREGPFVLRIRKNPSPVAVAFSFIDHIDQAEVLDVKGSTRQPCKWTTRARKSAGGLHGHPAYPAERHECAGPEHHFVGVTVIEDERWRPRRCIWAHPVDNKTLTLRFDDVALGAVIRGYASLPWWLERERRGAPVRLEVRVDGARIGTYIHEDGDGWTAFEFPSGRAGKRADVEFRISARDAGHRQFCFTADSR